MSSIPLVASTIQPQPNAAENIQRLLAIKSMLGQQALQPGQLQQQQQQIQATGLENQQRQIALNDQQATTAAMHEWDGKDINELPSLILKHGGSATAVFGAKNQITTLTKNAADADSAVLKNQSDRNDMIAGHLENVKSAPAEGKQDAYATAVNDLIQKGYAKPGQLPDQYPGDDKIDAFEKQFQGQKQIVDQELKTRQTNSEVSKNTAQAGEATAAAAAKNTEAAWYQQHPTAGAPGVPAENVSAADWLAKNPGKTFSDYTVAMKKIVPAYNFNLQNSLPAGPNGQPSQLAQDIANGTKKWSEVVSVRTPLAVKNQLAEQVHAINPDFDTKTYNIAQKVAESATSGQIGQNLTAFNTAIEHAKQLSSATDALGNGDVRALNQIGNTLGYQFGSDKTTNFNVIKNALSGEISKVFKGGGATDAEIEAVQAPFSAANSPEQLKGAINAAIQLMNSKRGALQQQVEQGMKGKPNFGGGAQGSAPAPKVLTQAAVQQAAKDHGVSLMEATRQAKAAGYTIQ